MAFSSVKNMVATVAEATPVQFDGWHKSWRASVESGAPETSTSHLILAGLNACAFVRRLKF